jgi:hypothetical protein
MLIVGLVVALLLMVAAMVRFSAAILDRPGTQAVTGWGVVYAGSWAAILAVFAQMLEDTPAPVGTVLTLAVSGWGAIHAFWLWLVLGLMGTPESAAAQTPPPDRAGTRTLAGRVCLLAVIVAAGATAQLVLPQLRLVSVPRLTPFRALILVAAAGVLLLVAGGVRLARTEGKPLTPDEIDRMNAPRRGMGISRHVGPAYGVSGTREVSLAEIRDGWRSGAWRTDREWRTMVMMMLGAVLMLLGGFGAAVVGGPPVVQLLCGGALIFVAFQLVRAVRRL